jgi:hypothetical protein
MRWGATDMAELGANRADRDRYQQLITALEPLFGRGEGRQTLSVRCDLCGNAEIASVRLISLSGHAWLVYGTIGENADIEDVLRRRLARGWQPSRLKDIWLLTQPGADRGRDNSAPTPQRRVRTRSVQLDVLNATHTRPLLVEAHCRTHGRFYLHRLRLMELPKHKTCQVRVGRQDRLIAPASTAADDDR